MTQELIIFSFSEHSHSLETTNATSKQKTSSSFETNNSCVSMNHDDRFNIHFKYVHIHTHTHTHISQNDN